MKTLLIITVCIVTAVSAASAHAFLDHADPKVGSVLKASPGEIKIWFTERVIVAFSEITLADSAGKEIALTEKRLDPSNGELLIVSVPTLAPGKYTVSWRVTAVDTHVTHGTFPFTLSP